jgi:hypothetical protein
MNRLVRFTVGALGQFSLVAMESRATHCSWPMAFISRSALRRSIICPNVAIPAVRQNRSKLAAASSHVSQCLTRQSRLFLFMALPFFCGFDTPSLQVQGGQRRSPAGHFLPRHGRNSVLLSTGHSHGKPYGTEERVYTALQGADHRPDAPPLNQPAARAWFPLAAGAAHEYIVLFRAAHRDPAAERAEFDGADPRWDW